MSTIQLVLITKKGIIKYEFGSTVTDLDLSHLEILELPKKIGNLVALQKLDLSNNELKEIPKEIGNLVALRNLSLSNNKLKKIPKEIGNLVALQYINLSSNELKEIPKEIGNLVTLQTLFLQHNELEEIPKETKNMFKEIPKDCSSNLKNSFDYERDGISASEVRECVAKCKLLKQQEEERLNELLLKFDNDLRSTESSYGFYLDLTGYSTRIRTDFMKRVAEKGFSIISSLELGNFVFCSY